MQPPQCSPACSEPQKCGPNNQCFTPVQCNPACSGELHCNPMNGTCMSPPPGMHMGGQHQITTMDNGTTVEVFKSLNYCQLAKTSLVSKRFRDLIRTNRHRLALLYVSAGMDRYFEPISRLTVFDKNLSLEEYNEWVIRNQYSKQIPLERQMGGMGSTQTQHKFYQLHAFAGRDRNSGCVFSVHAELNNENWPLFQHFIRLLTDPFIYLHEVEFDWTAQKDCFNLLTGIINPDRNRLQCHAMRLFTKDTILDFPNLITWAKCHLQCDKLEIVVYSSSDYDEELNNNKVLLDFLMTGGHCTSAFRITNYWNWKVFFDLAVKFMDFKKDDECQVVQSITVDIQCHLVEVFKRHLGKFLVKEKLDVDEITSERKELVFEFVNKDIDQKCQLTATYY
ncbi:hypothetical protein Ddc_17250 [Ditylenchus destructor]|nr:hypothetical protein Ddc_17250 [Ditylenchus destructor]